MGELVFVGLGLYDEKDITVKALEEIKKSDIVFAEFYTAKLMGETKKRLEEVFGKKIIVLSREEVESGKKIIDAAKKKKVVFACAGDPMMATTHVALRLQAVENKIKTKLVHGISIVTAAASLLGLQHYKFGRIATVPFPNGKYSPESPYDIIKKNIDNDLHTLVLLDIKEKRFMTANEGLAILFKIEEKRKEGVITPETLVCVVARASGKSCFCLAGYAKNMIKQNFGRPMHCLVIPGKLHFMEAESLIKIAFAPPEITRNI